MPMMHRYAILALTCRLAAMALLIASAGFFGGKLLAQGPSLAMLDRLQPGRWELRERDGGSVRTLCVSSGRKLLQVRHFGESCQTFVVEDTPGAVTVQYTCPATGSGRTRIRIENKGLAQLESQGVERGRPFDFSAEARRVGDCGH
jgi:hypothetical protein